MGRLPRLGACGLASARRLDRPWQVVGGNCTFSSPEDCPPVEVVPVPLVTGVPAVAATLDGAAGGSDADLALGPLGGSVARIPLTRRWRVRRGVFPALPRGDSSSPSIASVPAVWKCRIRCQFAAIRKRIENDSKSPPPRPRQLSGLSGAGRGLQRGHVPCGRPVRCRLASWWSTECIARQRIARWQFVTAAK